MPKTLYFIVILTLMSFHSSVFAQEGSWYLTPAIIYFDDDPDRALDDGIAGGSISGGWYFTDNLALEGALGYADIGGWFEDQTHLDLSVNLLAYMIPDASLSPYIIMGLGYLGTETASGSEENRPSGTLGAGIKWNLGDTRFAIRAEYRARLAWEKDFNFIDQIGSLGVQYSFVRTARQASLLMPSVVRWMRIVTALEIAGTCAWVRHTVQLSMNLAVSAILTRMV
jgi:hypothetical protein